MSDADRITDLEIRLTELERSNEELSSLVTEQWKTIEALRAALKNLAEQLVELEEAAGGETPVTKPPHW